MQIVMSKESTYPTPAVVAEQIHHDVDVYIEYNKQEIPLNTSSTHLVRALHNYAVVSTKIEITNKFEPETTNGAFSDAVPGLYENTWKLVSIDLLLLYDKDGNESEASEEFINQVKELL